MLVAATVPSGHHALAGLAPRPAQLELELRTMAGPGAVLARGDDGGTVRFVGGARPLSPPDDGDPAAIAEAFVERYGTVFTGDDAGELAPVDVGRTSDGGAAVRFQQQIDGVPVFAGELVVRVDGSGRVRSASGETVPASAQPGAVDTSPDVSAATAIDVARRVTARDDARSVDTLTTDTPALSVYEPSMIGAPGAPSARLTWVVEVRSTAGDLARTVVIDAHTAAVVLTYSELRAADSQVCDNADVPRASVALATCPSGSQSVARSDATGPSAVVAVERTYTLTKAALAFYASLGRNSIDGAGMVVRSTARFCLTSCPFRNAFWDGSQLVFGTGFSLADDVVGHELTHGVTQYESNLLPYAESGAIDESLSDVFGELFDQSYDGPADDDSAGVAWLVGEDLPSGMLRDMEDPTSLGDPDRMTSPLYVGNPSDQYGIHSNSGIDNKAAFLIAAGGTFNGRTITGIGNAKTAFVYYELQTSVLTPGADHADLFRAFPQACTNLIGQHGIVAADCASVSAAVAATEMDLAPTVTGARLRAAECPSGQVRTSTLFTDTMESSTSWTFTATGTSSAWQYTQDTSQSGTTALAGPDPATRATVTATMATPVLVPHGDTYMRFDHSFSFDTSGSFPTQQFWDGGFVRYSADNASFRDITTVTGVAALNGYNATLRTTGQGNDSVDAGKLAFSGYSPGYQQTRFDLGALAGQAVRLQFAVSTDSLAEDSGWAVDDVEIYTCGTAAPPAATPTGFVASSPSRVFDTRPGESPNALRQVDTTPVVPTAPLDVTMTGLAGGVTPATGVGAVSLNVTVTAPTADGFVTVYPCGTRTLVASVNFTAGQTVANAVIAPVSAAGHVCFFTSAPTDLVVDINGWFAGTDTFRAVGPQRVFDTRPGESPNALVAVSTTPVLPAAPLDVVVAGLSGGVTPATGVGAVSLNLTVTAPAADGFVTVYPCSDRRLVASINFVAGQTLSNAVVAPVSATGHVCFFTSAPTDLVVDINGWFPTGGGQHAVGPERVFDTRPGESPGALRPAATGRLTPGTPLRVQMTALPGGVTPATGVAAVALNLTVTSPAAAGFVTVYPCASRPFVSSINFTAGQTLSNAVIAPLAADGSVCFESSAATDLVVDISGWYATG
jgi:Zn-dependent metalloprotease